MPCSVWTQEDGLNFHKHQLALGLNHNQGFLILSTKKKKFWDHADLNFLFWTSLMEWWIRIHLPMQRTRVQSLVQEDSTCRGATKPMHHSYQARALGPVTLQLLKPRHPRAYRPRLLSSCSTTTEACVPRACAQQQEMPLQWETYALQQGMGLSAPGESLSSNENLTQPKIK